MKKTNIIFAILCIISVVLFMSACDNAHTHEFTEYVYNNDATCLKNGTETAVCSCSQTDTREKAGSKFEHDFIEYDYNHDATCLGNGTETATCKFGCGETDTREKVDSKLEHEYIEYTYNNDGNCLGNGTETAYCIYGCGELKTREKVDSMTDCSYKLVWLVVDNYDNISDCGCFECEYCDNSVNKTITTEDLGLPIVDFYGSLDGISKDNKVQVEVKYSSEDLVFESDATLKVQGSSSAAYPKKNFTIQLYKKNTNLDSKYKVEVFDGWGKQSKYCLKANWIDVTQSRNVVSAKLYGQTSESRNFDDEFSSLVNGGAIDGYPVVIYLNGAFHGLYTWNIPKDKWLFDMDGEDVRQALVVGDDWTDSVALKTPVNEDFVSSGWELEYCSTEDTEGSKWVVDGLNAMIDYLNNSQKTGAEFIDGLNKYVYVDRAIDAMLHTIIIGGGDNTSKNIVWTTYDGIRFFPCVYDMDSTWGLFWNGSKLVGATELYTFDKMRQGNVLWKKLFEYHFDEVYKRYLELRASIYSIENISKTFSEYMAQIPESVYKCEKLKWVDIPSKDINTYEKIIEYAEDRLEHIDKSFASFGK